MTHAFHIEDLVAEEFITGVGPEGFDWNYEDEPMEFPIDEVDAILSYLGNEDNRYTVRRSFF